MSYYWIRNQIQRLHRASCAVVLTKHCWKQMATRKIQDVDCIVRAIRIGTAVPQKSTYPNRICFLHYDGKSNMTYEAVAEFGENFIEVVTVWKRKGK